MNVLANSFNSYLQAKWLRLSKKTIPGKEMMLLPGIVFKMIGLFVDVDCFICIFPRINFSFEIDRLQD